MRLWLCISPVRRFTLGKLYEESEVTTAPEHILMFKRSDNGRPYWARKEHFMMMELV